VGFFIGKNKMLYIEADSVGPILEIVQEQIDAPVPCTIDVGRKGHLFTIMLTPKGADAPSGDRQA